MSGNKKNEKKKMLGIAMSETLYNEIENMAYENDMTKSAVARVMMERGLSQEGNEPLEVALIFQLCNKVNDLNTDNVTQTKEELTRLVQQITYIHS